MNIGQLLANMLEDLQRAMDEDDGPQLPTESTKTAREICRAERAREREAARVHHVARYELVTNQPGCMGTLRFHGDTGHLHGLLWAEVEPDGWAAYGFAAQLTRTDPHALMQHLQELGVPYHNPAEDGIPQYPKGDSHRPVRYDADKPEGE